MKLLSCGKVNLKIYIYIIIYALIELSFSLLNLYFQNNENDEINNVFINKNNFIWFWSNNWYSSTCT